MITLKNKKQLMVIVLALFMTFTVFGALLFTGLKKNVAKADGDTSYFAMEDGISIKLNEDGGMRFIAKMDTTIGEALINGEETMQFIIAPTALFDYADQNDMEYINLPKKIVVDVDKAKVYPDNADEPNYYYANGCVTKMYESNFNLTYEAVGYIVGERYTERNSNAIGAYYEKVNATFLNQNLEEQILGLERYNSWYGTEKYPVAIKNQSQYEKLVEKCNAGNTAYKGKVIVAEGGVQWNDADFTNSATKPELSKTASILADEISAWDEAEVIGSALNSSNVAYKIGGYNVYKTTGGYGQSIVNTNIVATNHTELHFAFKVDKSVYLSSGNSNTVKANTWYFVKLEKQTDGNWTIAVKAFGESSYTTLEASSEFFGAGNATFEKMFRTYLWADGTYNHEVYATDVWGVTKVDEEIATWEAAGAVKVGGALNSSEALAETLGGLAVYKTTGGFNQSIANPNIVASNYTQLYFAYKTNKAVALSNTDGQNGNKANTWYFVKLEKQADGNWTIAVKAFGDSDYTALTANSNFGAGATFDSMFKTNLWAGDNKSNHEVYATDVWGVTVVGGEVAAWEAAGAEKIGSALNSSEALAETLGGLAVYKTTGGYGQSIVNKGIVASNYTELHFAFKTDKQIYLSSGDSNIVKGNTWYFVKLEKQTDGSWTIAIKAFGDGDYTALTASAQFFGAGNATFETMFRTYLWAGNNTDNHEVYATDVWGVTVVGSEISAWEAAGAVKIGSALNSSEALAETLGGLAIYKTTGGFNQSIANLNIVASDYTQLYFAYKTNVAVALSNTDGQNGNKANTWYFVKLEKQANGSWTIAVKAFGDSNYTALTAKEQLFGAGATFDSMFKTNLWAGDNKSNHEVYATDVWGVAIAGVEVATWEAAGAVKVGSALNSSEALDETLGGLAVYKTNGGYGQSIANTDIVASNYTELHFAFKTSKNVTLSNGNGGVNAISANTWYFVKLEKQADGSWTISAKAYGASEYTALTADAQFFGADKATFDLMFKTYLWAGNNTDNHEVYATDVWGK